MNTPNEADGKSEPVGEHVRVFRRGKTWYANFQKDRKQHRVSLQTTNKKVALRKALKIEAELAAGLWSAAPEPVAVADAIAAYTSFLRAEDRSAKTLAKYVKVFERVAALARSRKVSDLAGIDPTFLDAYRKQRVEEGAAPKTRYTEAVIVRQMVNFALSRNLIAADPLKGVKLKKPKPTPQPCWTADQVRRILDAAPAEVKPALTLLARTGMRFGELAWLTWDDIDTAANLLHIRPKPGWKPKSGDRRAIPLDPEIRELLTRLPTTWRWVVTMPGSRAHPAAGRQWTERQLLAALKRILIGLDLDGKLHTMRHSFISDALLKGIPTAVVKQWVGHVSDDVLALYTHVNDEASQAAMRRLKGSSEAGNPDAGSAQNQHKPQEDGNASDAK